MYWTKERDNALFNKDTAAVLDGRFSKSTLLTTVKSGGTPIFGRLAAERFGRTF